MRKALASALMTASVLALVCSSCGGKGVAAEVKDIQSEFSGAKSVAMTMSLSADYGGRVFGFRLGYDGTADGGTITVLAPEAVAGAKIRIENGSSALRYDGAEVFTGEILPGGLSPADAVPAMLNAWKNGAAAETVRERYGGEQCAAAVFRLAEGVSLRTLFSTVSLLPLRSEIMKDGRTVITCNFENVRVE